MGTESSEEDFWIRDIDDEMMRQIEARAQLNGHTVEQETIALIEIGLSLSKRDR